MSETVKMTLNLDNSLEYGNGGTGPLRVKKSLKSGNTLSFESDGLYAEAIPGQPGSTGTGYPDNYRSANGVMSGVATPESMNSVPKRIVGPSIMHRVFTASSPDGSDIQLRTIDRVYPGDLYRVKDTTHGNWNYYIITKVASDNRVVTAHTGEVAIIPLTQEDVN